MARLLRAIGTLTLALPAILLSGCASTGCEEWGTRVESVKVCGPKNTNCTFQDQPVQYCVRKTGERAAPAAATRAPEKVGKPAPATNRPEQEPGAPASGKIGMLNLTPFWQSLFSASRYPGLRYGKVRRAT